MLDLVTEAFLPWFPPFSSVGTEMSTALGSPYMKVREQISNLKEKFSYLDMVVYPSTRKTEEFRVSGQPGLQSQPEVHSEASSQKHPNKHKPNKPNLNIGKIICPDFFPRGAFYWMRVKVNTCLLSSVSAVWGGTGIDS